MLQEIADTLNVPVAAVIVLGIVVVVQVALQLYSLIDLVRREHVTWGRKWLWALIILFVSSGIGAVLYLAVGRQSPPATDAETPPSGNETETASRAQAAVDLLYGPSEGSERR